MVKIFIVALIVAGLSASVVAVATRQNNECSNYLAPSFVITKSTVERSSLAGTLAKLGRSFTIGTDGGLEIQHQNKIEYRSNFNPITTIKSYSGAAGRIYLLIWSLNQIKGITNFDILQLEARNSKQILVEEAPEELLEAVKETYSPAIGRLHIVSVEHKDGYYLKYRDPFNDTKAIWLTETHIQRLMNAAGVDAPSKLAGYARVVIAPLGEMGRDVLVDRLSGQAIH